MVGVVVLCARVGEAGFEFREPLPSPLRLPLTLAFILTFTLAFALNFTPILGNPHSEPLQPKPLTAAVSS